jgi:hypothetical protein
MRKVLLFALAAALLLVPVSAPAQPPPPFTIEITSPVRNFFGVAPTVPPPVMITGISGAPNSTVTVKLIDNTFAVVSNKQVGTDAAGSWSCNFGIIPNGQYIVTAALPTGQSDITIFNVSLPDPTPGGGNP